MTRLIYDIESNGLLDTITTIHCIVTRDIDTGVIKAYYDAGSMGGFGSGLDCPEYPPAGSVADGASAVNEADLRIGHYIVGYDEAVLKMFFPGYQRSFDAERVFDTKVVAATIWPDEHLKEQDYVRKALGKNRLPGNLFGRHSLEAWGYRIGSQKDSFGKQTDWKTLSPEMLRYCVQDTRVTHELYRMLRQKIDRGSVSLQAISLEQEFAWRIQQQQQAGFPFDVEGADALTRELSTRRAELLDKLSASVPPFVDTKVWVTKVKRERKSKVVTTLFNPGSRHHVARHLIERLEWSPEEYTPSGHPQVTEEIISKLDLPGIEDLREYFKVQKILGMVSEGDSSWVKLVKPDGRIHGYVGHNSAVSARCTHSKPNVTQVPRVSKDKATKLPKRGWAGGFGYECRSLFRARPGWELVGGDASGLELRMLAHFMAHYDDGEYAKVVTEGDVHTANMKAAGLDDRDRAKTLIYALLYGAGNAKLAKVLRSSVPKAKATRLRLLKNTPALAKLIHAVRLAAARNKKLKVPDGRFLHVRSEYAALNTLLQGSGAIVMKMAVVLFHREMEKLGYKFGIDYAQVHQAHDEVQIEVRPELSAFVRDALPRAIREAGVVLGLRCPLAGTSSIGQTWAETH